MQCHKEEEEAEWHPLNKSEFNPRNDRTRQQ